MVNTNNCNLCFTNEGYQQEKSLIFVCQRKCSSNFRHYSQRGECSGVAETCWVSGFVGNEKKDIEYI